MNQSFSLAFPTLFFVMAGCFLGVGQLLSQETTSNEAELERIHDLHKANSSDLQSLIFRLNSDQFHFKPDEDSWSIAEIVEHIVITDRLLLEGIKETAETGPNPERREEITITEEGVMDRMMDRERRGQARPQLHPEGAFKDFRMAFESYLSGLQEFRQYLEKIGSEEDLRNYVMDMPFGAMDAVQVAFLSSAHAQRHFLQIKEVMADEDFPGR